jgi:hypothetical protein
LTGTRFYGEGIYAEQIQRIFAVSAQREGLKDKAEPMSVDAFRRPTGSQLELF